MWDEDKKSFSQYIDGTTKMSTDMKELEERCKQLDEKCSEFENAYFDIQMENIQLKSQIEKYRRANE